MQFYRVTNPFGKLALTGFLLAVTGSIKAEPADWQIDPEHFSIVFAAEHIGFQQQLGMFLEASGSFRYDPETQELSGGRVEVQADSVFSNHERRDEHLRSGDFLDAGAFPVILFEATDYNPRSSGDQGGILNGNLTLLGNTRPVELQVTINRQDRYPIGHRSETLGISAHTTILRSDWGMDYGVAGDLVGDTVTLRFEFEAVQQ